MKNRIFSILGMTIISFTVACNPPAPAQAVDTRTSAPELEITQSPVPLTNTPEPASPPIPTSTTIPPLEAHRSVTFTDLHMFDDMRGWGIEFAGHIVHTIDGGRTWQDVTPPQRLQFIAGGFFALNADTAWATPIYDRQDLDTNGVTIWHTGDGGKTWNAGPPPCLNGECGYSADVRAQVYYPRTLQFVDAKTGWLLVVVDQLTMQNRYRLYQTLDGGVTWNFIMDNLTGPVASIARGIAFTDAHAGWFGVSQVGGAEEPNPDWYLYKTMDGGHTWDTVDLPEPATLPEEFAQNPYGCGADQVGITPSKSIDLTFYCDVNKGSHPRFFFHFHYVGGGNWRVWQESGPNRVSFIDATRGWRLTDRDDGNHDLEQTRDGGLHWVLVEMVEWAGSLDFINVRVGWVLTNSGDATALFRTVDGGQTWTEIKPVTAGQ